MKWGVFLVGLPVALMTQFLATSQATAQSAIPPTRLIHGGELSVEAFDDGSYTLRSTAVPGDVLHSVVEVDTKAGTLRPALYPEHLGSVVAFNDELGSGQMLTMTHTGLPDTPDLVCEFRVYTNQPWGDIRVKVVNSTGMPVEIHSTRVVKSGNGPVLNLTGPDAEDRVLSDSFSEDLPLLRVMDLGDATGGLHRAFGSQLIYNRSSGKSLFLGALSADRFLTVFHLRSTEKLDAHLVSYDVEDTGTNEALRGESEPYGPENSVPLRLEVAPGQSAATERLMFAIGSDYHAQLENYGRAIRTLHAAMVSTPSLIGWWSWTAYYSGVTENTMLTNADWLAQNLAPLGYRYFQVDDGYEYAQGEYATADGSSFPDGVAFVGHQVEKRGLIFGLWVAPFQVSERSWVYANHKDWLVHNLRGEPIHLGKVGGTREQLYALDTTNPGAQDYLQKTYRTLVNDWGARFLKMDFMDSAAVEGVFYKPNTTAMEALRIGIQVIRNAVGDDVVLDKDGGPMLTPVGVVNAGRISQDTGHTFELTRNASSAIAARYYMNHNFYESDPDAFTVSEQVIPDRGWHGNTRPLTLDEAEASIALSAVAGGMFEIGDDLPALGASPQRLALVRNSDLLDMAYLGRASVPLDLMTYRPEDERPSIFLLTEDRHQWILTVFNWTEKPSHHSFKWGDLGLKPRGPVVAANVLRGGKLLLHNDQLIIDQSAHSVRMIKLIDSSVPAPSLDFEAYAPAAAQVGAKLEFKASSNGESPVLRYQWDFGDGVKAEGSTVTHAYTQPGKYKVTINATGLDKRTSMKALTSTITGRVHTAYDPAAKVRYLGNK